MADSAAVFQGENLPLVGATESQVVRPLDFVVHLTVDLCFALKVTLSLEIPPVPATSTLVGLWITSCFGPRLSTCQKHASGCELRTPACAAARQNWENIQASSIQRSSVMGLTAVEQIVPLVWQHGW